MREIKTHILITGALAAHCVEQGLEPAQVRRDSRRVETFQELLHKMGVRLAWPQYARITAR